MTKATEAQGAGFTSLYVGTMNDGLFIIDRPPRPAPKDYDTGITHQVNVIATMANNDREASKLADLFAASPALYEALKRIKEKTPDGSHPLDGQLAPLLTEIGAIARAALAAAGGK